jgi:hypothetical protein
MYVLYCKRPNSCCYGQRMDTVWLIQALGSRMALCLRPCCARWGGEQAKSQNQPNHTRSLVVYSHNPRIVPTCFAQFSNSRMKGRPTDHNGCQFQWAEKSCLAHRHFTNMKIILANVHWCLLPYELVQIVAIVWYGPFHLSTQNQSLILFNYF